jgi:hypothetical protein
VQIVTSTFNDERYECECERQDDYDPEWLAELEKSLNEEEQNNPELKRLGERVEVLGAKLIGESTRVDNGD